MSEVSRDPNDYHLSVHAMQRRRGRSIPIGAIKSCIEDGEVVSNGDGVKLRAKYGAITYWAALDPEDGVVKSCGVV